jgi:DNA repair exonuclease SbcCD ATPase subunit
LIQVRSDLADESNQVLEKGAQIVELKDTVRAMGQDQAEKEAENEQQMAEWKSEIQELRHLSDANDDKQNQLEDYRAQMLEGQQSQRLLELQQEKAQQAAESNAQAKKDLETHLHEKEQQLFDKHLELKDALSPPRQQGWFTQSVPAQPDIRDEMTKLQKELSEAQLKVKELTYQIGELVEKRSELHHQLEQILERLEEESDLTQQKIDQLTELKEKLHNSEQETLEQEIHTAQLQRELETLQVKYTDLSDKSQQSPSQNGWFRGQDASTSRGWSSSWRPHKQQLQASCRSEKKRMTELMIWIRHCLRSILN